MAGQLAGRLALIAFVAAALRGVPARAEIAATFSTLWAVLAIFFVPAKPAHRMVEEHARQVRQVAQTTAERHTTATG